MSQSIAIDRGDRDFLGTLAKHPNSTIPSLCEVLGVTATAVRQRLQRLQDGGLVVREVIPSERGRPFHTYQITPDARRHLGNGYADIAVVLWKQLQSIENPDDRARIGLKVEQALAERYGHAVNGATLPERFAQLTQALCENGFATEVDVTGALPILREQHCPYSEMADLDASICELEQRVFESVLGSELELVQSCRTGGGCCEFQAVSSKPAGTSLGENDPLSEKQLGAVRKPAAIT